MVGVSLTTGRIVRFQCLKGKLRSLHFLHALDSVQSKRYTLLKQLGLFTTINLAILLFPLRARSSTIQLLNEATH